jgi:AcrR family transcriptional regulator
LYGEIVSAARAEFAQYGFAGARIDRIAKTASASKERLYAHFGDKETLFRQVVAADAAKFFEAVTVRPDAVPEFVGDIYDLALSHPEHLRMVNWARLEGVRLTSSSDDDQATVPATAITAIRAAQATGYVDSTWQPEELLIVLFGVGLAWAQWPDQRIATDDADQLALRRAAAVEAAARITAVPGAAVGGP